MVLIDFYEEAQETKGGDQHKASCTFDSYKDMVRCERLIGNGGLLYRSDRARSATYIAA